MKLVTGGRSCGPQLLEECWRCHQLLRRPGRNGFNLPPALCEPGLAPSDAASYCPPFSITASTLWRLPTKSVAGKLRYWVK